MLPESAQAPVDTFWSGCHGTSMPLLLEGKPVAESIYAQLRASLPNTKRKPKLAVVLVGSDPASQTYVRSKAKKCEELGMASDTLELKASTSETELLNLIAKLNADDTVTGILVQLPLPSQISRHQVSLTIDPFKDVDGLHPVNAGLLMQGQPNFIPCTPAGIMEMLNFYKIEASGKKAVVIGRSEIVGKPMALLLQQANATVTVCHSKTPDIEKVCREAEILVVAMGKPKAVTQSWVSSGAVVVDVGIHRVEGKLCGDVDFEAVQSRVSAISPVPGGVGPLTIAMLMQNVLISAS